MPDDPDDQRIHKHAKACKQAYRLLTKKRAERVKNDEAYSSREVRKIITDEFLKRTGGKKPYSWQLDVAEALLLGLDCVVIAGTGAGKTMPFMMPIFFDEEFRALVLSPLIELQIDMAGRMITMGVNALAVNGRTWSPELYEKIKTGHFQVLLAGPEMIMEHAEFSALMRTPAFTRRFGMIVLDEVHCMQLWGSDFRIHYSKLETLRSFVSSDVPILATSATLTPASVEYVTTSMKMQPGEYFFLNLGNDRPNIMPIMIPMKGSVKDLDALNFVVHEALQSGNQPLVRTLVFVNHRITAQRVWQHLVDLVPPQYKKCIEFTHALRQSDAKEWVMEGYKEGEIDILIATDVAGMGTDIPSVTRVVQYMVPGSLPELLQHFGRAGRAGEPSIAILLLEATALKLQRKKKKQNKGKKGKIQIKAANINSLTDVAPADAQVSSPSTSRKRTASEAMNEDILAENPLPEQDPENDADENSDDEDQDSEDSDNEDPGDLAREDIQVALVRADAKTSQDEPVDDDREVDFAKVLPQPLRTWVDAECRRAVADEYFDNPPREKALSVPCCDRCLLRKAEDKTQTLSLDEQEYIKLITRISHRNTPVNEDSLKQGRKPKAKDGEGPRRGERLVKARDAIYCWRNRMMEAHYRYCTFDKEAFFPIKYMEIIAKGAHIRTVEDIKTALPKWLWAERHGDALLDVLRPIDEEWDRQRKAETEARKRTKSEATQASQVARAAEPGTSDLTFEFIPEYDSFRVEDPQAQAQVTQAQHPQAPCPQVQCPVPDQQYSFYAMYQALPNTYQPPLQPNHSAPGPSIPVHNPLAPGMFHSFSLSLDP